MARLKDIVIDADHPAALARFWAAALDGYSVAPYDEVEISRLATLGLTPETDTTTHYFFEQAHPSDQGDDSLTEGIYQSLIMAFNEDRDMITAQHENMRRNPAAPMVPLTIDGALVQFRRLLAQRVEAEGRSPAAAPR